MAEPAPDRLADPERAVRGELEALCASQLLDFADQAEHALLDEVTQGEALALVLARDRDHETQVRVDHPLLGSEVAALDALEQLHLLSGEQGVPSPSLKKSWRESSSSTGAIWRVSGFPPDDSACQGSSLLLRFHSSKFSNVYTQWTLWGYPAAEECSYLGSMRPKHVCCGVLAPPRGLSGGHTAASRPPSAPHADGAGARTAARPQASTSTSDPSRFSTPPARATAARSLLDEAERRVRRVQKASRADPPRLQATLERRSGVPRARAAHRGARRWPCSQGESRAEEPNIRPCATADWRSLLAPRGPAREGWSAWRWCGIVSRHDARIFRGSPDGLARSADPRHRVRPARRAR